MPNSFREWTVTTTLQVIIAWIVLCMGLSVMMGWAIHSRLLVQILPSAIPMQFNTALGFSLSALGFLSAERYRSISISLGLGVFLLASLSLTQYLFSIHFHIDEFFIKHFLTDKSFHPGRMSPSTALSFILVSITLFYQHKHHFFQLSAGLLLSIGIFLLATSSLMGYLLQLPKVYSFGQFTGMAIHTATSFLLISVALLMRFWKAYDNLHSHPKITLPLIIFISGISIFFLIQYGVSQRLYHSAETELQKRADSFSSQIMLEMNSRLRLFQRFYERHQNISKQVSDAWTLDARSYLNDIPSLRVIIFTPKNRVKSDVILKQPILSTQNAKQLETRCQTALITQTAFKLSLSITEWQKRHYLCIQNIDHTLLSIIELKQLINQLFLHRLKTENMIFIKIGQNLIYQNKALPKDYTPPFDVSSPLNSKAFFGTLQLVPLPLFIQHYLSNIPLLIFFIGFLTTSLLSITIRFWQLAKVRLEMLSKSTAEISYLAYHDSLTGLLNRTRYDATVESIMRLSEKKHNHMAILLLDLDRFKHLNDTYGHDAGDALLVMTASLLKQAHPEHEHIFRIGGDEFSLILENLSQPEEAAHIAKTILDLTLASYPSHIKQLGVSASIGIATYPIAGTDKETLTKHADVALYHAKRSGKNTFQFFSEALNEKIKKRFQIESHIFSGFQNNEFYQLYQPILSLQTNEVVGLEVLLRWNSSVIQQVLPDDFIPIAEKTHLIIDIARWSFKQSLSIFSKIHQTHPHLTLSINLSPQQIIHDTWCEYALETLKSYSLPSRAIKFELTETDIIDDLSNTRDKIDQLVNAGFQIHIDDFGTGYNSLQLLREFPVNGIKIDKQFVADLNDTDPTGKMIRSIISIAQMFDLTVTAEGVETDTQYDFILEHHCQLAQGFYFARPLTQHELLDYLSG